MKVIALLLVAIGLTWVLTSSGNVPSPNSGFAPSTMASMDRSLAKSFFKGMATAIDYDANKAAPLFASDVDLINYRVRALDYATQGGSFESKYNGFGNYVGNQLDSHLGKEAKTLDRARRTAWVVAYQDIAKQFEGGF